MTDDELIAALRNELQCEPALGETAAARIRAVIAELDEARVKVARLTQRLRTRHAITLVPGHDAAIATEFTATSPTTWIPLPDQEDTP
jgi:hypothetical protein